MKKILPFILSMLAVVLFVAGGVTGMAVQPASAKPHPHKTATVKPHDPNYHVTTGRQSVTVTTLAIKQLFVIFHTSDSVNKTYLAHVWLTIESVGTATAAQIFLERVSTGGSGGTSLTSYPSATTESSAEATTLALPSTLYPENGRLATYVFNFGVTSTITNLANLGKFAIYEFPTDAFTGPEPPALTAGVEEGLAVGISVGTAAVVTYSISAEFSE